MLLGRSAVERLANAHVAVFGLGGVGGHVVEALARSGVGELTLVDSDDVAESNINRQAFALRSTVGMNKTDAAEIRVRDINPDCVIHKRCEFFLPETADSFDFSEYDYVVDAIDTVAGKIAIAKLCDDAEVPAISAMGAGNKLDPTKFEVCDIYKTSVCPLAAAVRRELRRAGVRRLKVVYSRESAIKPEFQPQGDPVMSDEAPYKRNTPASCAFVPSVCGLIIAGEVIRDLCAVELAKSLEERT